MRILFRITSREITPAKLQALTHLVFRIWSIFDDRHGVKWQLEN